MEFTEALRALIVGVTLAGLAGCEVSKEMAIDKGKDMLASTLKDPDSARFQNVFMVEDQVIGERHYGYLCGEVNSKNSFGGFTGFHRFVANFDYTKSGSIGLSYVTIEEGDRATLSSSGATIFHEIYWLGKCEPRPEPVRAIPETEIAPAKKELKQEISKAEKSPKIAKPVPTKTASRSSWAVQIASMSDSAQAENLRVKMSSDGYTSYAATKDGKTRVFVGPFADRSRAEGVVSELRTKHLLKGFVIKAE